MAAHVEANDRFLRVHFGDPSETHADFHYFWLRHNCDCCRHPLTGERTLCSSSVPMDIAPASVALGDDGTTAIIVWNEDGAPHRSVYAFSWLHEHAYALNRDAVASPSNDMSRLELSAGDLGPGRNLPALCADRVRRYGAVVVRQAGMDTEALIADFTQLGWTVIETHFGRIEDLRTDNTTNRNTDQLGYTDAPVDLHTDQPFLDEPPRYQMLHCMRPADTGGENLIVDARQAALYLRSIDATAFTMLATTPVRFDRRQKQFRSVKVSPVIEMRGDDVYRVRSSYFTMAPHMAPFDRMAQWYRSYNRFAQLVMNPKHQYRFLLAAGDLVFYDNFRMLHARTGFSGPRWVRGVYFS